MHSLALLVLLLLPSVSLAHIYNERCIQCIEINVYFHAIAFDDCSLNYFNASQSIPSLLPRIEANMEVLNHEFNNTPFSFVWKQHETFSVACNSTLSLDMCDWESRTALNKWRFSGDFSKDINVYLGHRMYDDRPDPVGCASFPVYTFNTINLNFEVLPPEEGGVTLAHEVGHWLGLIHTSETGLNPDDSEPCNPQNPGDSIDDTPMSAQFPFWKNYTNQTSYDSCPNLPGKDPFFNIMNIVCRRHRCFEGDRGYFTEGQIQRMYENWLFIREGDDASCTDSQYRLKLFMREQKFANHQFILFDDLGYEVVNLRKFVFSSSVKFQSTMCLNTNVPYALVLYHTPLLRQSRFYSLNYWVEGSRTSFDANLFLDSQNVSSLLFLPSDADPELPLNTSDVYVPTTFENGCDSSEDALLEVTVNGTVSFALFDSTGQGVALNGTQQCIPKGRYYSIVISFVAPSEAEILTVTLDGMVIYTADGPFYNYAEGCPRMISTIITPATFLLTLTPTIAPSTSEQPVSNPDTASSPTPSSVAISGAKGFWMFLFVQVIFVIYSTAF